MRRLAALVRHLPRDSATVRAVEPAAQWSDLEHLVASLLDATRAANWQRGGDKRAPRPAPVRRPGQPELTDGVRIGTTMPLHAMRRLAADWAAGRINLPARGAETVR